MRATRILVLVVLPACSVLTDLGPLARPAPADGGTNPAPASDDGFAGRFELGTFADTRWDKDHVTLESGKKSGSFTSRVFDAGAAGRWARLRWTPGAPYDAPLPDKEIVETGYLAGSFDMMGNVWLLHFEDTLVDASGHDHSAVFGGAGAFGTGRFGRGLADTTSTYAYTTVAQQSDLATGTGDFTWSLWVSTTQGCDPNVVHLGLEDVADQRPHLWMGCASAFTVCPNANGTGRFGGTFATTPSDVTEFCGSHVINDGTWHLLTLVKSGHASCTARMFVDGALDGTLSLSLQNSFFYDGTPQLAIGAFSKGTYQAAGAFDEIAIWKRALSDDEVGRMYRRAALRLSMKVRSCAQPACADAPLFAGPNGDPSASFRDPGPAPPAEVKLDLGGRYFQYRAELASDVTGESPALFAVTPMQ